MYVCMRVCICVCRSFTTQQTGLSERENLQKTGNLCCSVFILEKNLSAQLSGRYWPESGHDWKKPAKNGLFLEVFGIFNALPDEVFI